MLYSRLDGMTKPCDLPNWFDINIFDQQAKKHWRDRVPAVFSKHEAAV